MNISEPTMGGFSWRKWVGFVCALGAFTASPLAAPSLTQLQVDASATEWVLSFQGAVYDPVSDTTTFTYNLQAEAGPIDYQNPVNTGNKKSLSHWVLGLSSCNAAVVVASTSPVTESLVAANDPTTGVVGLKWDDGQAAGTTASYSVTLQGSVGVASVPYSVKGGTYFALGSIQGPGCPIPPVAPPAPQQTEFTVTGYVTLDPATCSTPSVFVDVGGGWAVQIDGFSEPLEVDPLTGAYSFTATTGSSFTLSVNPPNSSFYLAPGFSNPVTVTVNGADVTVPTIQFNQFITLDGSVFTQVGAQTLPFSGVTVALQGEDEFGSAVNLSTTTDANGHFLFENLKLAGPVGYTLTYSSGGTQFFTETLPGTCIVVESGDDTVVTYAVNLSQVPLATGVGRTIGFWKAQLSSRKGNGYTASALTALLAGVNGIALPQNFNLTITQALALLDAKENNNPAIKLAKQLLAAELNSVDPTIGGLTNKALQNALFIWGEYLLLNGTPQQQLLAKDLFDLLNNKGH